MGHRSPRELLENLRVCLRHSDDTGHLGETETIAEIKRRPCVRIAEVEAELRVAGQSKGSPESAPPE